MKQIKIRKLFAVLSISLLAPLAGMAQGTGDCIADPAVDCPADGTGIQLQDRQRLNALPAGAQRAALQNEDVSAAMEQFRENRQLFRQEMALLREQLETCTDEEKEVIREQIREQLRTFREEQRELRRDIQRELRAMRQERRNSVGVGG